MGFTLFQLGKALYDKSLGDAFGACKNLYDQYKQKVKKKNKKKQT